MIASGAHRRSQIATGHFGGPAWPRSESRGLCGHIGGYGDPLHARFGGRARPQVSPPETSAASVEPQGVPGWLSCPLAGRPGAAAAELAGISGPLPPSSSPACPVPGSRPTWTCWAP